MKLTNAQEKALSKLTDKHQSAYTLQESISTLRVLVKLGLAESKCSTLGSMFSPRTANTYRKVI